MRVLYKSKYITPIVSIISALIFVCAAINVYAEAVFAETPSAKGYDGIFVDGDNPLDVLAELDEARGTHNSECDYKLDKVLSVAYGNVYKYRQLHNGADIPSGDIVVCTDKDNKVLSVFGSCDESVDGWLSNQTDSIPSIAVSTTQTDAFGNTVDVDVELNYDEYGLFDYTRNIFTIDCSGYNVVYYYSYTGEFEPIAVTAFLNVIKAYDFYTNQNNIGVSIYGVNNGNDDVWGNYNDRESEIPIMIYMHYGDEYENANCGYNSEYNLVTMYVGDGKENGNIYLPAKASDVIGHEYQHAVTQFVADFEYFNDSGALNEAISDIFGALIEGCDVDSDEFWTIGENCVSSDQKCIRSIKGGTPEQIYDIADKIPNCELDHNHMECNYGGTHQNSTIISHIQYELYEALPDFFTRERIGTLWYSTLCTLTRKSTFEDFGLRFYRTAQNLGYDDRVCGEIFQSLSKRGLLPLHMVTFKDYDGSVLCETQVLDEDDAVLPDPPTRESDNMYDYEFKGWSSSVDNVTADITVIAEYGSNLRTYSILFKDLRNSKEIFSTIAYYGSDIATPDLSVYAPNYHGYRFDGWFTDEDMTVALSDAATVTGDMTFYGKWTKIDNDKPDYALIISLSVSAGVVVIAACVIAVVLIKRRKKQRT